MEPTTSLVELAELLGPLAELGTKFAWYTALATLIQFCVEKGFAWIFEVFPNIPSPWKQTQRIPALALGIAFAFALDLNIVVDLAKHFNHSIVTGLLGWEVAFFRVVSGFAISMGAGHLTELFQIWGIRNRRKT
jgi:hypothetical protein